MTISRAHDPPAAVLADAPPPEGVDRDAAATAAAADHEPVPAGDSAEADLALQQHLLAMIARNEPLEDTLTAMCHGIERRYEGVLSGVLLVDDAGPTLRAAAAPSLPAELVALMAELPIDPAAGTPCGQAAATGQVVVVEDVSTSEVLDGMRPHLDAAGLRSVWSVPLRTADGAVLGTFALYREHPHAPSTAEVAAVAGAARLGALAVERHHRDEALRRAATVDPLTGLPNRATFLARLGDLLAVDEVDVAVLFMDVNQFKLVNDSLGHRAGDRLLVELAQRLRAAVPEPDVVARFGGDEFTVLVVDASPERLTLVADRIDTAFEAPFALPGGAFQLTAALGIATARAGGGADADALIRDADTAMYASKANRLARVHFDDRLRRQVLARMSLETALQHGLAADQFQVGYQGVVDLRTGERRSVEALVRWVHPERGPVSPGEFIELAEETGLIVPLGARVLDIALRDIAVLAAAGRAVPVAVNVSAIQLSDPSFSGQVARALADHGLDPALLVLELTESAALDEGRVGRRTLDDLAAMGVTLVVDDFATGYASVPLLRELPVVGLKIDRSFTMAMATDPRMRGVVGALTDLAHALELYVVAEGIDTAESLAVVTELGCDLGQGFHLSPTLTGDQL